MRLDLRVMEGRTPKCEMGTCRAKASMSLGDATARGGMGRFLVCEDCAKQLHDLLDVHFTAEISPTTNETPSETNDTAEDAIVEPAPVETLATGVSEDMTKAELIKLAEAAGITVPSKATKTDLIELLAIHG